MPGPRNQLFRRHQVSHWRLQNRLRTGAAAPASLGDRGTSPRESPVPLHNASGKNDAPGQGQVTAEEAHRKASLRTPACRIIKPTQRHDPGMRFLFLNHNCGIKTGSRPR